MTDEICDTFEYLLLYNYLSIRKLNCIYKMTIIRSNLRKVGRNFQCKFVYKLGFKLEAI